MCACGKRQKSDSVTETEKIWLLFVSAKLASRRPFPFWSPWEIRANIFSSFLVARVSPRFGRRVKTALNKREEKSEGKSYSSQPDLACLFSTQCCTAPFPAVGCYKICLYLHFSPRCRSHKDSFSPFFFFPAYFLGRRGDRLVRSISLELKHTYTHTPAHTHAHTHKPSSCSVLHQGNSEGI